MLAGAGTGKTAVVIGKIAHLVRNQGIAPDAILTLAFNRKAAMEIRERLRNDLKGANVSTFHSFSLKGISGCGTAPSLSKVAQDDFAYGKAIDNILNKMKTDQVLSRTILDFLGNSPAAYMEQFDFATQAEYEQYVRDNELRTFNGELVKSFEELIIANFLCQNGIRYQYEARYEHDTATSDYRQYQPDFYLLDHGIYIEHFALNRDRRPPTGWTGYAEGAAWKRALHAQHGTELLETYSWQHRDDSLLSSLEEQLRDRGVGFRPVPTEDLVDQLSAEKLSVLSRLLGTFLHHVKSANLSGDEVQKRISKAKDSHRARRFAQLFNHTKGEYARLLREEQAIDFHDLINQAAELIRTQQWTNPYRYVLIDEFQDISDGRMALRQCDPKAGPGLFPGRRRLAVHLSIRRQPCRPDPRVRPAPEPHPADKSQQNIQVRRRHLKTFVSVRTTQPRADQARIGRRSARRPRHNRDRHRSSRGRGQYRVPVHPRRRRDRPRIRAGLGQVPVQPRHLRTSRQTS